MTNQQESARFLSALGQMAIAIAHEMRNLLGSVELCAGMLAGDLKDDPQRGELVQTLIEGVHALNGIVTNLLTFARPCRPSFVWVGLHTVLDEALVHSQYAMKEKQIRLVKTYAAPDPVVWGDMELLKQVFLNLILNAVQAMPNGGMLTITTRVARGQSPAKSGQGEQGSPLVTDFVEVSIADTGCGIPPELLDRIFEPFFTTKARGTGLGLALVRRILDQHRAVIQVESETGRGTRFTLGFPLPVLEVCHGDLLR